jgi:hypothetical protein
MVIPLKILFSTRPESPMLAPHQPPKLPMRMIAKPKLYAKRTSSRESEFTPVASIRGIRVAAVASSASVAAMSGFTLSNSLHHYA